MEANKSCGCQALCCMRAAMRVEFFDARGKAVYAGDIADPCSLCGITMDVRAVVGADKIRFFKLRGPPASMCAGHRYAATIEAADEAMVKARLTKLPQPSCSGTNRYALEFPEGISDREKAMLLGAQIFLENAYFERGSGDRCGHVNYA